MDYPAKLTDTFDFGKHRGYTVKEVIDTEPTYIDWAVSHIADFDFTKQAWEYNNHIDEGNWPVDFDYVDWLDPNA